MGRQADDSPPAAHYEECRLKSHFLRSVSCVQVYDRLTLTTSFWSENSLNIEMLE